MDSISKFDEDTFVETAKAYLKTVGIKTADFTGMELLRSEREIAKCAEIQRAKKEKASEIESAERKPKMEGRRYSKKKGVKKLKRDEIGLKAMQSRLAEKARHADEYKNKLSADKKNLRK